MRYKLIVFDWDGTLMDSEARIVACIRDAFVEIGERPPSRETCRNIIGLGLAEALAELWPEASDAQRRHLAKRYRARFSQASATPSPLFPGVRELLGWLRHQDCLLAVATGKSRRGLDGALADTGLSDYFHTTRCADDAFSKPHPQMLLEIMVELGVQASDTLMVGDTEYDMQMARNAGTGALAACYGVHERERLLEQRPLGCLKAAGEIRGWLAQVTNS